MNAIETTAYIDEKGNLHLDEPLLVTNLPVKIIILISEEEDQPEVEGDIDVLNEPSENNYALPDKKLLANVTREIKRLPEHLLPGLQDIIAGLLAKKQPLQEQKKKLTYEERLKELMDLADLIEEKDDFDAYVKEFEESRKDRPLPFREP